MDSLFRSDALEEEYFHFYDKSLELFELPYESKKIKTSFGRTHVLIFGDQSKKPLILLHGMMMSSTMWYPNVKHLVQERCVYAIDIVGDFGKSKVTTIINSHETAADWLHEVADGLHLQQFDLAGHSMGGYMSLIFTLAYPKRVSKLLLYAPVGSFYRLNPMFYFKVFPAVLFNCEWLIDRAFRWFSGRKKSLHPVFRKLIVCGYMNATPKLHLIPKVFPDEAFQGFKHDTLLLIGEKEVVYPANKALKNAKRLIPHIKAYKIKDATHMLTQDHASIVNEYSINFLKDKLN